MCKIPKPGREDEIAALVQERKTLFPTYIGVRRCLHHGWITDEAAHYWLDRIFDHAKQWRDAHECNDDLHLIPWIDDVTVR